LDNGDVISVPNEGNFAKGKQGNLFIQIKVIPHNLFARKGDDTYSQVEIGLTEALNGASRTIQGIHGPLVVTIPKGIQPGHVLRLRHQGVNSSKSGIVGDHYLKIEVKLPQLSTEQISKLREILGHDHPK
jgi:molecular chaperone DnaJ